MFLIRIFGYLALACLTLATPVHENSHAGRRRKDEATAYYDLLKLTNARNFNQAVANGVTESPSFKVHINKAVADLQRNGLGVHDGVALEQVMMSHFKRELTVHSAILNIRDAVTAEYVARNLKDGYTASDVAASVPNIAQRARDAAVVPLMSVIQSSLKVYRSSNSLIRRDGAEDFPDHLKYILNWIAWIYLWGVIAFCLLHPYFETLQYAASETFLQNLISPYFLGNTLPGYLLFGMMIGYFAEVVINFFCWVLKLIITKWRYAFDYPGQKKPEPKSKLEALPDLADAF
ncbi:hypothetical protein CAUPRSCDRAFT_10216 [Caulochytrium protostelioides]|uniref:Uncharacterized protein n=1 Tax=Caulochytrium protostelioides TaxID=1555241 RepID=A0A4P9X1S3_9FUNG|nr:hypothetical protein CAUPRSCDRAFT_10216 [Caulochytrium protostelioides]